VPSPDGPIAPPQSVIEICSAAAGGANTSGVTVSISGVNIEGDWPANVCYDSLYGVLVGGGATLNLSNSAVTGIGGSALTDGCQGGVGIQVGLSPTDQIGHATLTDVYVSTYQKNGITIDGTGSSATISGGSVTGVGPTPSLAQNGIQVSFGATASISGVTVSGNQCTDASAPCGPDPWSQVQSSGVLLYDNGLPTTVTGSTINDNDYGVASIQTSTPAAPGVVISNDTISGGDESVYQDSGWAKVKNDRLSGAEIGIWVPVYNGQPSPARVTAKDDIITGMSATAPLLAAAVEVESDGSVSDYTPVVTVKGSDLSGNPYGVLNNDSAILTATGDFWGSGNGPSDNGIGTTATASGADVNVTFFPWATSVSDSGTTATTGGTSTCTSSGTLVNSHAADAILCLTGPGSANYHGPGPVLVLGNGSDDIDLGAPGSPVGISLILNGGSSNVLANGNSGVYELENGASAAVTDGGNLQEQTSPLVTQ
jgi:hypothetical protein